ncbi:hypothetical protein PITC_021060 [Penicillium italicum]|uniref:Uncharacterized protein n=1 Tax=Penicillium italicum TaxID=40296 RepID=A0A0A2KR31_PENIT|nr:hypothetical protein PITC_021060 [Penicillium italicum]
MSLPLTFDLAFLLTSNLREPSTTIAIKLFHSESFLELTSLRS